jgi:LysR family glycine cleavage system transcriptional activator
VSCLPHFSAKVLMPGRPAFQRQHPGIELAIQHSLAPPDLDQSGIQFGIRFGLGKWPGLICDLLLQSDVAPACAGQLLNDGCRLLSPADLAKVTILLDDDSFHELWVNWFEINGLVGWESLKFTKCDDVHVLLEAATDGHAVVLEPEFLISNLLKSGRLVHPFDYSPVKAGYYLTYTANALDASECRLFRDWILTHMDGQRHMA